MDSQDNQQIDQDDLLLLGIQLPDANYLEEKEYDEKRYKVRNNYIYIFS